ncbi:MAG TPA: bifunctional nuclease family protein [Candidatus Methylomirabilis sp.]|nr:bifunctional nuclease family protein [Candidatus Methylomirabilis sp.]
MYPAWSSLVLALLLAIAAPLPAARAAAPLTAADAVHEMEVMGVAPDPSSGAPLVYLRAKQDKRELSMFIGPFEAQGIILPLQNMRPPRPYTHDLMLEALHRLKAKVKQVVITDLRDNTYYANLVLDVQGQEITLDSRPSDAIALALRENAPILAAEKAFARSPRPSGPGPAERGAP